WWMRGPRPELPGASSARSSGRSGGSSASWSAPSASSRCGRSASALERLNAIVMAAGEGSRLRPLTERWAKPVLPIDGRPVLATLLRELAGAGIERATVVTVPLAEQVEAVVGDGSGFGVALSCVRQPRPD